MRLDNFSPLEFYCGIHSGFPICCILFFLGNWPELNCWIHGVNLQEYENASPMKLLDLFKESLWSNADYIQCPNCISEFKKPIEVKDCLCPWARQICEMKI